MDQVYNKIGLKICGTADQLSAFLWQIREASGPCLHVSIQGFIQDFEYFELCGVCAVVVGCCADVSAL
jgi:hypothetical protein